MLTRRVAGGSRDLNLTSRDHDARRTGGEGKERDRNYRRPGTHLGRNRERRGHHGRPRKCPGGVVMLIGFSSSPSREWDSSEYHRLSQPQVSWGKKVLSRLRLHGDELLLDAGCGTGRLTAELLQALPRGRVVALDISQNMLRSACEYLQPRFGRQVLLVAADLRDLPFECIFDGIVSTAAFHWVLNHECLRSEEHTSELQSPYDLVCRLLLEK